MGDQAQRKFAQGWAIGLAISQATQFKDMAIVALQATAVLSIMETFWLVGNKAWLEEHIGACGRACVACWRRLCARLAADFASVHATVIAGKAATMSSRLRAHLAYFSAVA